MQYSTSSSSYFRADGKLGDWQQRRKFNLLIVCSSVGNAHRSHYPSWVGSQKMITTVKHDPATSQRLSLLLFIFANLLIPTAILIFATGFFPYKPFLPGRATFQDISNGGQLASAPFDKVIFMVVDALRRLTPNLCQLQSIMLTLPATSSTLTSRASNSLRRELPMSRVQSSRS